MKNILCCKLPRLNLISLSTIDKRQGRKLHSKTGYWCYSRRIIFCYLKLELANAGWMIIFSIFCTSAIKALLNLSSMPLRLAITLILVHNSMCKLYLNSSLESLSEMFRRISNALSLCPFFYYIFHFWPVRSSNSADYFAELFLKAMADSIHRNQTTVRRALQLLLDPALALF